MQIDCLMGVSDFQKEIKEQLSPEEGEAFLFLAEACFSENGEPADFVGLQKAVEITEKRNPPVIIMASNYPLSVFEGNEYFHNLCNSGKRVGFIGYPFNKFQFMELYKKITV